MEKVVVVVMVVMAVVVTSALQGSNDLIATIFRYWTHLALSSVGAKFALYLLVYRTLSS